MCPANGASMLHISASLFKNQIFALMHVGHFSECYFTSNNDSRVIHFVFCLSISPVVFVQLSMNVKRFLLFRVLMQKLPDTAHCGLCLISITLH